MPWGLFGRCQTMTSPDEKYRQASRGGLSDGRVAALHGFRGPCQRKRCWDLAVEALQPLLRRPPPQRPRRQSEKAVCPVFLRLCSCRAGVSPPPLRLPWSSSTKPHEIGAALLGEIPQARWLRTSQGGRTTVAPLVGVAARATIPK